MGCAVLCLLVLPRENSQNFPCISLGQEIYQICACMFAASGKPLYGVFFCSRVECFVRSKWWPAQHQGCAQRGGKGQLCVLESNLLLVVVLFCVCFFSSLLLVFKAAITSRLCSGRSEVLRNLRQYLWIQNQEHHTIDDMEERGIEKDSGKWSTLKEWDRAIVNQTNIESVPKATFLGKPLRDGVECLKNDGLPGMLDTVLNWTKLNGTEWNWCVCSKILFHHLYTCFFSFHVFF